MTDKVVLEEIRVAHSSVADAQSELARLLQEVEVARRAEKTKISEALHNAVQKLREAREHLEKLETLIGGEDDRTAEGPLGPAYDTAAKGSEE